MMFDPPELTVVLSSQRAARGLVDRTLSDLSVGEYRIRSDGASAAAWRTSGPVSPQVLDREQSTLIVLGHVACDGPQPALKQLDRALERGDAEKLREFQGVFVACRVDWSAGSVRVASDLLAIRPFYVARQSGTLVLTDRAEVAARLIGPAVDPLGLAGWMLFHVALSDRTLYRGVSRIRPYRLTEYSARETTTTAYWQPTVDERDVPEPELTAGWAEEFAASQRRLLGGRPRATVLLSGGFDSRFVLLQALRDGGTQLDAVSVPYDDRERRVTARLASAARCPCRFVNCSGSIWDRYEDMWFSHPDGYPISKNLTWLAVMGKDRPGPFIDGALRGCCFEYCGDRSEPPGSPTRTRSEALERAWQSRLLLPELALHEEIASKLTDLGRAAMEEQVDAIGVSAKFRLVWNLHVHTRRYISTLFNQYQSHKLSLHPFYDRLQIERRLRHRNELFTRQAYRRLLADRFGSVGGLEHASDRSTKRNSVAAYSHALRRAVLRNLPVALTGRAGLRTAWLAPRLAGYALGLPKHLYLAMMLARLGRLDRMLKATGVRADVRDVIHHA
jgi:hypothetical protein